MSGLLFKEVLMVAVHNIFNLQIKVVTSLGYGAKHFKIISYTWLHIIMHTGMCISHDMHAYV